MILVAVLISCNHNDDRPQTDSTAGISGPLEIFETPERPAGQEDVIELRCEPLDTVRMAIIGLGMRGAGAVHRYTYMEGVEIKALCDLEPYNTERAQQILMEKGLPKADLYNGAEDYKTICEREDIDLVYICTNWTTHTPIAVCAMEHGKHAAVEVPAAQTIEECWQLVNTSERTRRHCMQLENCNYDFFEMATLNMAQQGLFGEIVHGEGAYIHDLRHLNFAQYESGANAYHDMWRINHLESRDGNLYPTHGLGPVCHIMNIHRGDRMTHLVSMSSKQAGMTAYAREKYGEDSEQAQRIYRKGDMNTSLVRTENGKTIMIQHDVTSPRPYSRIHMVSGTKGFAQKWPVRGLAFDPDAHHFLPEEEMEQMLKEYEHPIVTEVGERAREVGGHGGMDFIMDYRLIYCLRNGLPLDQDVYDAAEWSAISELSVKSVELGSMPIAVPDFTRGAYKKVDRVTYYTNPPVSE
ncbi:MAG: Gfo/Idh/MocA family oxidoreductase [Bacteroidota bacterium]